MIINRLVRTEPVCMGYASKFDDQKRLVNIPLGNFHLTVKGPSTYFTRPAARIWGKIALKVVGWLQESLSLSPFPPLFFRSVSTLFNHMGTDVHRSFNMLPPVSSFAAQIDVSMTKNQRVSCFSLSRVILFVTRVFREY